MKARKVWLQWYRTDADLFQHPKTIMLANTAGWEREVAVARLHRMWSWVARHAPSGTASGLQAIGLEQHMRDAQFEYANRLARHSEINQYEFEPGEDPFELGGLQENGNGCVQPFVVAGFVEVTETGSYIVHDWYFMNGHQLRERERDHDRKESASGAGTARERRGSRAVTETETETDH